MKLAKMNLIESKVTAMIALGLGSLFTGFLPVVFTRYSRNRYPLFLSTLLCFGAGVLLSTSMIHMLPEIRESLLNNAQYAELLFCGGFFILYCIDEIVHLCKSKQHTQEHHSAETQGLLQNARRHSIGCDYGTIRNNSEFSRQPCYNPNYVRDNSHNNLFIEASSASCSYTTTHSLERIEYKPSQLCHIAHQEPCRTSNTSSISLIIALTVHAVLEGLAVGLEDSTTQVLLMLGAVASHKFVVGFCVGTELSSSQETTPFQYFISIVMFSFGSVIGIGLGLEIADLHKKIPDMLIPVLQGLTGGTLLYITVSEVLPRERAQWHQKHDKKCAGIFQFIAVILGFILMTTIIKFIHE